MSDRMVYLQSDIEDDISRYKKFKHHWRTKEHNASAIDKSEAMDYLYQLEFEIKEKIAVWEANMGVKWSNRASLR